MNKMFRILTLLVITITSSICAATDIELKFGIEPFASETLLIKLADELKLELKKNKNTSLDFQYQSIPTFEKFIDSENLPDLFYGHPGYANYLISYYGYIPIITLKSNNHTIIIKHKNHQSVTRNTVYSLPSHDIFSYLGKRLLSYHPYIYKEVKTINSIVLAVLKDNDTLGIVSSKDLDLLAPILRGAIRTYLKDNFDVYSYVLLHPKHKSLSDEITQNIIDSHEALSIKKSSYFYNIHAVKYTADHDQYVHKFPGFLKIFNSYKK